MFTKEINAQKPMRKNNRKIAFLFIFTLFSCALFAQENKVAPIISQMAIYSQGLAQKDGSLLVAKDFGYASEGINFYPLPNGDLYIENGGILLRFSPDKPVTAFVQNIWNTNVSQFVEKELAQYEYPPLDSYNLTLYCNAGKTQFITLKNSHQNSPCKGCDYMPPYLIEWHDSIAKQSKTISLPQDLFPAPVGLPKYALCKGNIFYYEHTVSNPDKTSSQRWCPVIRAHHISSGKNEVFVSTVPDHCEDILSGPMAIPATDYLLYQRSNPSTHQTHIEMKKAL